MGKSYIYCTVSLPRMRMSIEHALYVARPHMHRGIVEGAAVDVLRCERLQATTAIPIATVRQALMLVKTCNHLAVRIVFGYPHHFEPVMHACDQ